MIRNDLEIVQLDSALETVAISRARRAEATAPQALPDKRLSDLRRAISALASAGYDPAALIDVVDPGSSEAQIRNEVESAILALNLMIDEFRHREEDPSGAAKSSSRGAPSDRRSGQARRSLG
jgi:hypothetical protein